VAALIASTETTLTSPVTTFEKAMTTFGEMIKATVSVSSSMESMVAMVASPVNTETTIVVSAEPLIAPRTTNASDIPISTCLIADKWERVLLKAGLLEDHADVLKGIQEGFYVRIGDITLTSTYIANNHFCTEAEVQIVHTKFTEEITLCCLSPPFNPATLESQIGPFRTAPMAVLK
jgi:hypothetical protein